MKLASITNPQNLLEVLEHCQRQVEAQSDQTAALPDYLSDQLAPTTTNFWQAYLALQSARELLGQVRVHMRSEERELREMLRDGYHCARRYARKQTNPELIHSAFGLHHNGRFPTQIKDLPNPTLLAQRMLEANEAHSPAGDNILRMPNPTELTVQKDKLIAALDDYHVANSIEREALERMSQAREQAETLLLSIKAHLRIQSRSQSEVARRQLMRSYGFQYKPTKASNEPKADETRPTQTDNTSAPPENTNPTNNRGAEANVVQAPQAAPTQSAKAIEPEPITQNQTQQSQQLIKESEATIPRANLAQHPNPARQAHQKPPSKPRLETTSQPPSKSSPQKSDDHKCRPCRSMNIL